MLVAALSMLFLAGLLNLIAIQYAEGVVRAALDEGVRVGSVARASEGERLDGIKRVMSDPSEWPPRRQHRLHLHRGRWANGCVRNAEFDGWFPGMPSVNFSTDVRAVKESDE